MRERATAESAVRPPARVPSAQSARFPPCGFAVLSVAGPLGLVLERMLVDGSDPGAVGDQPAAEIGADEAAACRHDQLFRHCGSE